jgi:hypothetical protein
MMDDGGAQSTNVHFLSFTEYILQHPALYLKKVALDVPAAFGVFVEALHFSFLLQPRLKLNLLA